MKVAVSIPDPIFNETEMLAKALNASRSEVYARALDAFLAAHVPDRVTAAIDEVVADVGAEADSFVRRAGRQVAKHLDW